MIILDSNVWVSLLYKQDINFNKAKELVGHLRGDVIVTEYIIIEVTTILSQRQNKKLADLFLEKISKSDKIKILSSSKEFLSETINFYLEQENKHLSFVDHSLLFLSQRYKIVTFDKKLKKEIEKYN